METKVLNLAASKGYIEAIELALEHGANINTTTLGYTPLMEAARNGHEEVVTLLLNLGADINVQSEAPYETALSLTCCAGFLNIATHLITKGANIELGAPTPIIRAAQKGHIYLVGYLIQCKANIHAQTPTGDTALTLACENGHTEIVKLLLRYGADVEHESEGGRTPLMIACRSGHMDIVKCLLSKGADINKNTTNGQSPLYLAFTGGHHEIIKLLRKLKIQQSQQPQMQPQQSHQQPHSQQQTSQQQSHHHTIQQQQQQQQYWQPPVVQQLSTQPLSTVNQATGITDSNNIPPHQSTSYAHCTAYDNQVATHIEADANVMYQQQSRQQQTSNLPTQEDVDLTRDFH